MNKILGIGLVLVAIVAIGAYFYPKVQVPLGASSQGATGNTARQYSVFGVNLAAPGANATSSSIVNGTGQDMYVTGIKAGCEGVGTSQTAYTGTGLATLTLSVATSSTAAPVANANANVVGGGTLTIGTSTANFVAATSTATGGLNSVYNIWKAGSYMTFTTNATNTAVCTFGVDTFGA